MTEISTPAPVSRAFLENSRKDAWWAGPTATAIGLLAFVVYSTWAALVGAHYEWGPYLSPMYSPLLPTGWLPESIRRFVSPAVLILWAPGGFRVTCYYYRKAYYRALFLTPAACAVGARPQKYRGERMILLFQNLHRFFLYLALIFIVILTYDAVHSFIWNGRFGMGVGSIVMTLNAVFLGGFTFGCNSLRHLVGGNVDCYSCAFAGKQRHGMWRIVSWFNANHMGWAWISLFWVGFTDFYIRMVSMGIITDLRIL
ncbi:MAG TPA: succinate dehydrogenase [bacterium]